MLLTPPEAAERLRVSLRMVYALLSGGHGLHQVAQVLGHKTVQSTKRYAHLYPEAQVAALASIFRRKA